MKAGELFLVVVVKMLLVDLPFCESGKSVAPPRRYFFPRNYPAFLKKDKNDDYMDDETLEKVEGLEMEPMGKFVYWTRKKMSVYMTGDVNESDMVVLFYDEGGFSRNVLKIADSIAKTGGLLVVVPDFEYRKFGRGGSEFYVRRGRESKAGGNSSSVRGMEESYEGESQEVVVSAHDVEGKTSEILQYVFDTVLGKLKILPDIAESDEGAVAETLTSARTAATSESSAEGPSGGSEASSRSSKAEPVTELVLTTTQVPKTTGGIVHFVIPILSEGIVKSNPAGRKFKGTSERPYESTQLKYSSDAASKIEIPQTTSVDGDTTSATTLPTEGQELWRTASTTPISVTSTEPTIVPLVEPEIEAPYISPSSTPSNIRTTTSAFKNSNGTTSTTWIFERTTPTVMSSSSSSSRSTLATRTEGTLGLKTVSDIPVPTVSMKSIVEVTSLATTKTADLTPAPAFPGQFTTLRPSSAGPQEMISYLNKSACVMGIGSGGSEVLRIATNLAISRYKCGVHIDTFGLAKYDARLVQFPLLTMWSRGDSLDYERFGKAIARKFGPKIKGTKRFPRMQPGFAGSSGNLSDPGVRRAVKEFVLLSTAYIRLFLKKPLLRPLAT